MRLHAIKGLTVFEAEVPGDVLQYLRATQHPATQLGDKFGKPWPYRIEDVNAAIRLLRKNYEEVHI